MAQRNQLLKGYYYEKPVFSNCPSDLFYGTVVENGRYAEWIVPTATDNSGNNISVVESHKQVPVLLPVGNTDVTYTAVDPSLNTQLCEFTVTIYQLEDIPMDEKLIINMLILNDDYSPELEDPNSTRFIALMLRVESGLNSLFAASKIENYKTSAVTDFGPSNSIATNVTIVYSEPPEERERLDTLNILYSTVRTQAIDGIVYDRDIYVNEEDGSTPMVTWCYVKPCLEGMNCKLLDDRCIATCSNNQDYCLNDGICYYHSETQLVKCNCPSDTYYGIRCQVEDLVSDAQMVAILASIVWLGIFIFSGFILCVVNSKKCCTKKISRTEKLPDEFFDSDSNATLEFNGVDVNVSNIELQDGNHNNDPENHGFCLRQDSSYGNAEFENTNM
ncbi:uncharacterized protein LOC102807163 [Saccoglossus kowalevskii]